MYNHLNGEGKIEAAPRMDESVNNIIDVINKAFEKKKEVGGKPNVKKIGGPFNNLMKFQKNINKMKSEKNDKNEKNEKNEK